MISNATIQAAFNDLLIAANLGYPVSWPGLSFTPPDSGVWFEAKFLPNRGVDDRLSNQGHVSPQGIYQITVFSRPQSEIKLREAVEIVAAAFPAGTAVTGSVRTTKRPFSGVMQSDGDRVSVALSIEYGE